MKIQITMKDPDTLHDAIREAVEEELSLIPSITDVERDELLEGRCERLNEIASKWFKYGEYLTVELDSDANTCAVIPQS